MAAKYERAPIDLFAPAASEAPSSTVNARFEEATLRLARLIGRQIAREEVRAATLQRQKERKEQLKLRNGENRHDNREELTRVQIIRIMRT